jgi:hypothetical protein
MRAQASRFYTSYSPAAEQKVLVLSEDITPFVSCRERTLSPEFIPCLRDSAAESYLSILADGIKRP